ncbi:MAG: hypothetical protein JXD22_08070 [Sedimentisphaerales bacterium]|nr:hypothetical protein [Sedimentisphaerales bacterium]
MLKSLKLIPITSGRQGNFSTAAAAQKYPGPTGKLSVEKKGGLLKKLAGKLCQFCGFGGKLTDIYSVNLNGFYGT